MHAPMIVNELTLEDFLNPQKKGFAAMIKDKYYNWNSEFNIKKTVLLCYFDFTL